MRKIDLSQTTLVETVELSTRADMYVYEVFYINKIKPLLNRDDKAKDNLIIELPELNWQTVDNVKEHTIKSLKREKHPLHEKVKTEKTII